ncbi:MAG: two-component sensor histidine kinase [Polaromonas sp.]|uniref:ATP-binding protein n=1 Tax=Polaromonas sp. TaxID=1869339 RepID=UPI00184CBD81|nr:ATP-binding protein [Polaromonas sp.]NMM09776.1 two-component sensor histidine kinase [Polaromonas sp.]
MSLRLRLLLMIGISLSLLWGGIALWMLRDLDKEMHRTLDQRLAMSAQMVAGLMSQNPAAWDGRTGKSGASMLGLAAAAKGLACQVSLRGEVIARTPGAAPEAVAAFGPGFAEREFRGERWRSYTVEAHGFRVTTADRLTERNTLLRNVMEAAVVPFVVAMIGSLIALWFGVKKGLLPLERLRQALASRAPDTLTPLPAAPMSRDLLPLVTTLNQVLEQMSGTLRRERRFTSDAAHELRTPLTAIKTHLQVARITRGAEAAQALEYAQEGVARLQHTLTQLLTLSQVEGPFSWNDGRVAYADEVARLAIRDAAPEAHQQVVFDNQGCSAELALPQALAVTALRNLLDNAIRHSPSENSVRLELQPLKNAICFRVCDSGPGLSAEELTLATQRFWRRGPGRGTGLGLSIVAAITERFGGALELAQRPDGGLEAKLTLPTVKDARSVGAAPNSL